MPESEIERNKRLSRTWFEEVWNKRNRAAIDQLADPNAVTFGLVESGQRGTIAQFVPFWEKYTSAFPDCRIDVEDVIAEGDKTCIRIRVKATHTGEGLGAPTGNRVDLTGLILVRWRDGKIGEAWNEFDAYGLMQQLSQSIGPVKMKA
jgi:predicted ester cyclase